MANQPGNEFSAIHNNVNPTSYSTKDYIRHYILNVLWEDASKPSQSLHFKLELSPKSPTDKDDIVDYMERKSTMEMEAFVPPRLYDIDMEDLEPSTSVNHSRFIVLQLHPKINWEFSPGSQGVSAKRHYCGEDADIRFLKLDGKVTKPGEVVPPGCRMLSWHVLGRPDDGTGNCKRDFNFHIDFLDDVVSPQRRLPTIFDPSVPNSGGGTIP